MKKILKVSLFSLIIASSCMALTNKVPKNSSYNKYYYPAKTIQKPKPSKQLQQQTTNINIIVQPVKKDNKKIIKNCKLDSSAPIAPYIDNY